MIRLILIFWLIVYCVRQRVIPYYFFQLNRSYFNSSKNIFSKLDMDRCIPERWRLWQIEDDGQIEPELPVFFKPEWGQNSHGIFLVRDSSELHEVRQKEVVKKTSYLIQESALEEKEYELFYIRSVENSHQRAIFSITEVKNKKYPDLCINGVHNKDSSYHDVTADFTDVEQDILWTMLEPVGQFRLARVGLRADSKKELLAGNFHIIEVNIFLPLPLILLDKGVTWKEKHQFIRKSMALAARQVSTLPRKKKNHAIFLKQLIAHYKVKGC